MQFREAMSGEKGPTCQVPQSLCLLTEASGRLYWRHTTGLPALLPAPLPATTQAPPQATMQAGEWPGIWQAKPT